MNTENLGSVECKYIFYGMSFINNGFGFLTAIEVLLAGILLFIFYDYAKVLLLRRKLPPGPFPRPLFGNRGMMPRIRPWIKYDEWSKQYDSPIITVWLGSSPTIILNDAWVASELLDKKASIYSSRPRMVIVSIFFELRSETEPYRSLWAISQICHLTILLQ
jgi:hypothetical protein